MAKDKQKRGRVTPKATPPEPAQPKRRRGPNAPIEGPLRAGKRDANPGTLLVIAISWIGFGIIEMVVLHAWWRFLPGVVMVGIGLLFLRGAAISYSRDQ